MHSDLVATKKILYDACSFTCSLVEVEAESAEYGASHFTINNTRVLFRVAKITPTKTGQFVTLWKRLGAGAIKPYDRTDDFDAVVISVKNGSKFGQFVFPKNILCEQKIVASDGAQGKLGFRVYPAWDTPTSNQAQKAQQWQLRYFLEIPLREPVDCERAACLYSL